MSAVNWTIVALGWGSWIISSSPSESEGFLCLSREPRFLTSYFLVLRTNLRNSGSSQDADWVRPNGSALACCAWYSFNHSALNWSRRGREIDAPLLEVIFLTSVWWETCLVVGLGGFDLRRGPGTNRRLTWKELCHFRQNALFQVTKFHERNYIWIKNSLKQKIHIQPSAENLKGVISPFSSIGLAIAWCYQFLDLSANS